jgi:hypothetical protein
MILPLGSPYLFEIIISVLLQQYLVLEYMGFNIAVELQYEVLLRKHQFMSKKYGSFLYYC